MTVNGVVLHYRDGAWIAEDTILGRNVTILPGAVLGRPPISTRSQVRKTADGAAPLRIGDNSVIGANAVIYRDTCIGADCLVGDTACIREQVRIGDGCIIAMGVTINYNAVVGSRVKVMDNSHLTGNMVVEDDVFISVHVSTTNDNSMGREAALGIPQEQRLRQGPIIRRFATIGQGALLLPAVEIGENAIVGAGAVVHHAVSPRVLVLGNPARVIRQLEEKEIRG
jgi:acetyltransferase-like isoleucine patch superfamily enzyme